VGATGGRLHPRNERDTTTTARTTHMNPIQRVLFIATCAALTTSCSESKAIDVARTPVASGPPSPAIAAWRGELLDLAFEAASAFPLNPHVKNRSRAQADAVTAALAVDQPDRAVRYAEGIANWRRGEAYADIAFHQADHGRLGRVQEFLDLAQRIADEGVAADANSPSDAVETSQEWRRDRVRAQIARTYLRLGQDARADTAASGAIDSETAPIHAERARGVDAANFDAHMTSLDALVATGSFDPLRSALDAYAELFSTFYGDAERRRVIEEKIPLAWAKLPIQVRLETQEKLVGKALEHGDEAKALELVDAASVMLDSTNWNAEANVPLRARLAGLRARAGDVVRAREEADAALVAYDREREQIVNIYRASVLRPLAQAYHEIGDSEKARAVYFKALDEGVLNPNSRPRADDLVATICSMVTTNVEPDVTMRTRIGEIRSKLGAPW